MALNAMQDPVAGLLIIQEPLRDNAAVQQVVTDLVAMPETLPNIAAAGVHPTLERFLAVLQGSMPTLADLKDLMPTLDDIQRSMVGIHWPLILAAFWAWGRLDQHYQSQFMYKPVPLVKKPKYKSKDVSIVVCTIGPVENFEHCLKSWLANDPLELIIVTTADCFKVIDDRVAEAKRSLSASQAKKIRVMSTDVAGKRVQMVAGVNAARGKIIATVDDHIFWPTTIVKYMLPCFEEPGVRAAGPGTGVYLPEDRRNPETITKWEAVATRLAWKGTPGYKAMYAASGWIVTLAGTTAFYRASILKDRSFQRAHLNDNWFGHTIDVGDDTSISRWVTNKGWKQVVQAIPETEILRTVKQTQKESLQQFVRWERSTVMTHWRQLWNFTQLLDKPYVLFKMLERTLRPATTILHTIVWGMSFWYFPRLSTLIMLYYIYKYSGSYAKFIGEFPFMWPHLWALVMMDFRYILLDFWAIGTISNHHWGTREVPGENER
ncbi:polysaccharide synthase [Xylariomycetidae sp. FL0641]|nr:polysaccharide synthase [Xylariomycetidae sp. FL0641]